MVEMWAHLRSCPEFFDDEQYSELRTCWNFSSAQFGLIKTSLREITQSLPDVVSIAVAGSYGRMEALPQSDLDLIVIIRKPYDGAYTAKIMQDVWYRLEQLQIKPPLNYGIFAKPVTIDQLTAMQALGNLDYSKAVFGIRMQLLLDAQPIVGMVEYQRLIRDILNWYSRHRFMHCPQERWTYLLNDLIRYYRSYCVLHDFMMDQTCDDSWYIRQIKLRYSRLLSYAGLLLLVATANIGPTIDAVEALAEQLTQTPLERIHQVFTTAGAGGWATIAIAYQRFLHAMRDDGLREMMVQQAPVRIGQITTQTLHSDFIELIENAEQISKTLNQFVVDGLCDQEVFTSARMIF